MRNLFYLVLILDRYLAAPFQMKWWEANGSNARLNCYIHRKYTICSIAFSNVFHTNKRSLTYRFWSTRSVLMHGIMGSHQKTGEHFTHLSFIDHFENVTINVHLDETILDIFYNWCETFQHYLIGWFFLSLVDLSPSFVSFLIGVFHFNFRY